MSDAKFEYRISPPIQNAALNDLFTAAWVHVDYEPRLSEFYKRCGFGYTEAGLMGLE